MKTSDYALNYGTILGAANVAFALMLFFLDAHYQQDSASNIVGAVLVIGFVNYGIFQFRQDNDGFISLSEGLKIGVGIALVSAIITTLYGIILTEFMDPQFMDKVFEIQRQKMLESNPELSEEDASNAIEISKNFTTIPFRIAFGILGGVIFGFIISLIGGLILKRSKPQ
tara:strand:- start:12511 stop:13020 length:510 start_codon:yes stop_codon:yes gene_type:complete